MSEVFTFAIMIKAISTSKGKEILKVVPTGNWVLARLFMKNSHSMSGERQATGGVPSLSVPHIHP